MLAVPLTPFFATPTNDPQATESPQNADQTSNTGDNMSHLNSLSILERVERLKDPSAAVAAAASKPTSPTSYLQDSINRQNRTSDPPSNRRMQHVASQRLDPDASDADVAPPEPKEFIAGVDMEQVRRKEKQLESDRIRERLLVDQARLIQKLKSEVDDLRTCTSALMESGEAPVVQLKSIDPAEKEPVAKPAPSADPAGEVGAPDPAVEPAKSAKQAEPEPVQPTEEAKAAGEEDEAVVVASEPAEEPARISMPEAEMEERPRSKETQLVKPNPGEKSGWFWGCGIADVMYDSTSDNPTALLEQQGRKRPDPDAHNARPVPEDDIREDEDSDVAKDYVDVAAEAKVDEQATVTKEEAEQKKEEEASTDKSATPVTEADKPAGEPTDKSTPPSVDDTKPAVPATIDAVVEVKKEEAAPVADAAAIVAVKSEDTIAEAGIEVTESESKVEEKANGKAADPVTDGAAVEIKTESQLEDNSAAVVAVKSEDTIVEAGIEVTKTESQLEDNSAAVVAVKSEDTIAEAGIEVTESESKVEEKANDKAADPVTDGAAAEIKSDEAVAMTDAVAETAKSTDKPESDEEQFETVEAASDDEQLAQPETKGAAGAEEEQFETVEAVELTCTTVGEGDGEMEIVVSIGEQEKAKVVEVEAEVKTMEVAVTGDKEKEGDVKEQTAQTAEATEAKQEVETAKAAVAEAETTEATVVDDAKKEDSKEDEKTEPAPATLAATTQLPSGPIKVKLASVQRVRNFSITLRGEDASYTGQVRPSSVGDGRLVAHGMGIAKFVSGGMYAGMFDDGKMQGTGTLHTKTGEKISGNFVNDEAANDAAKQEDQQQQSEETLQTVKEEEK